MSVSGLGGKTFDATTINAGQGSVPDLSTTLEGTVDPHDYIEMITGLPVASADFYWDTASVSSDISPNPMRTFQVFEDTSGASRKLHKSTIYRAAASAPSITNPQFDFEHFDFGGATGAADVSAGAYIYSRMFKAADMTNPGPGMPREIASAAAESVFWEPANFLSSSFTIPQSVSVNVEAGDVLRVDAYMSAETAHSAGLTGSYGWFIEPTASLGATFTVAFDDSNKTVASTTLDYEPQHAQQVVEVTTGGVMTFFALVGPWGGGTTPPVGSMVQAYGFNMIVKRYTASSAGTVSELPPFTAGLTTAEQFVNSFAGGGNAADGGGYGDDAYGSGGGGKPLATSNTFVVVTENGPEEFNATTNGLLPVWDVFPRGRVLSTETIAIMAGSFGGPIDP